MILSHIGLVFFQPEVSHPFTIKEKFPDELVITKGSLIRIRHIIPSLKVVHLIQLNPSSGYIVRFKHLHPTGLPS